MELVENLDSKVMHLNEYTNIFALFTQVSDSGAHVQSFYHI